MTMRDAKAFEERYRADELPWDTGHPDPVLKQLLESLPIPAGRALEVGCGTGTNALWLSRQGFDVTAVDFSERAIEMAHEKAGPESAVRFEVADVFEKTIDGGGFDLVYDRGCFHLFDEAVDRERFAEAMHRHLKSAGLWLSQIGNADDRSEEDGPPQRSALEIVSAVEPHFEVLRLESSHFDTNLGHVPRAWVGVFRCR